MIKIKEGINQEQFNEIKKMAFKETKHIEVSGNNNENYEGNWLNDKREGKGIMKYNNGDIYDGDWENDKKVGNGKMKYKNGDIYEGEWKDDKKNGYGKYRK